ncbi:MAG: glycoside hydrolase family protein [Lentisphaerae bacterium]|nr:glycoside hydrolase family protein [Lentisphaerota bacterium]
MKPFLQRLLPAPIGGGFRREDAWIWCGSVLRDSNGLCHMFASLWEKTVPFSPNWLTNSRIVHAVSPHPEQPFRYRGDVFPPRGGGFWDGMMTHNPSIHKYGDTYLLFYTGTTYDAARPAAGTPVSPELARQARRNQRIGLATAPSLDGPWRRSDAPCLDVREGHWDRLLTTNPAPCVLDDGRILLLYKSTSADTAPIQYGVAMAASPGAPFERLGPDGPIVFGDAGIAYEDAYVWRQEGLFHMLFNDMTGKLTGEDHAGAQARSNDGIHWRLHDSPKAYSRTLRWTDGAVTTQGSLERPQLLFHEGKPTHLFAATADGPGGWQRACHTWNMVIPLAPE